MYLKDYAARFFKKLYRITTGTKFLAPECNVNRADSNEIIFDLLRRNEPAMISRFGTTELIAINNYLTVTSKENYIKKTLNYITDYTQTPWWNKDHFENMSHYSGIFPPTRETAERFSRRYLNDIPQIDLLGCHQHVEKFMPLKNNVLRVQLEMLYPFYVKNPWTRILKDKKVLVIHPFEDTIRVQYKKRKLLFDNEEILPDFQLLTYKAVQSVAGNRVPYSSWFDALKKMEDDISRIDFDFALIGCGAYGLPLAAHVKRLGKKSIHIGGGLQLMFGILGNRWTKQYENYWHYRPGIDIDTNYKPLFNKFWIYPLDTDTPENSDKMEGGCYWK